MDRRTCLGCGGGELLYVRVMKTGTLLRVCEECDSTLEDPPEDGVKAVNFETYMMSRGVEPSWSELSFLDPVQRARLDPRSRPTYMPTVRRIAATPPFTHIEAGREDEVNAVLQDLQELARVPLAGNHPLSPAQLEAARTLADAAAGLGIPLPGRDRLWTRAAQASAPEWQRLRALAARALESLEG